jgi:hypothetical protein
MVNDKRYRECMAEIIAVLRKYDMAGAITVVDQNRAMFKYHFPTWSCIILGEDQVRFRSKREDYPSAEAQRDTAELSAHIVMQMRDIGGQTFALMERIGQMLKDKLGMEHTPHVDFDPEREH